MSLNFKTIFTVTAFIFSLGANAQMVIVENLQPLLGFWEGELTYLNYNSDEESTIKANLLVGQKKDKNEFFLSNRYPDEKSANSSYKVVLSKDGMEINKKPITSAQYLDDKSLEVVLEYEGKDNGKNVQIRHTYTVGKEHLSIKKEFKQKKAAKWTRRNEYRYKRSESDEL